MSSPFYDRLKKYYEDTGKVLRGEAAAASIFLNPTDIGMTREGVYRDFLGRHIPANCTADFGGFLFNLEGLESRQIDIIVYFNSCLQFKLPNDITFACIEGTIAVVCVKSSLTTDSLFESLENLASIPEQRPLGKKINPLFKINN